MCYALYKYKVFTGKVIRGLEQGVLTMKVGEKAALYIQPDFGYGRGGIPGKLPEDTPIIYETEIISIECKFHNCQGNYFYKCIKIEMPAMRIKLTLKNTHKCTCIQCPFGLK